MQVFDRKLISATAIGVLLGLWFHHRWAHQRLLGREAYLLHEGQQFDRFLSKPHSYGAAIFGGLVLVVIIVAAYELLAMLLNKLAKNSPSGNPRA